MDISIGTPASIPTPPAGEVALFLDSTNNNILSYKDENDNVFIYSAGNVSAVQDSCCCEIAKDISSKLANAAECGVMSAAEYQALMNQGFSVTGATTDDGSGNTTCSVNVGPLQVLPESLLIVPNVVPNISAGGNFSLAVVYTPANTSDKHTIWTSSNPAVAIVDSNGVVYGIAAGSANITATSAVDGAKFDTVPVTVV